MVIGKASVNITNINSGGDCGIVSYFVFKYEVSNFKMYKKYRYIEEINC